MDQEMDIEQRVNLLESTILQENEQMKEILLDIRIFLVEAGSPMRPKVNSEQDIAQGSAPAEVANNGH